MQIDPELESDLDSEVDEGEEDGGFNDVMERHIDMLQDDEGDNFEPAAEVLGGSHVQFLSCLTSRKPTGQHFIQRQHYGLLMKNYKPTSCWTWMHREKMMWM